MKIHRFNGEFNHSKLMTVDGRISYIGSANMDFRSMEFNFELTSIIYNEQFTQLLEQSIKSNIETHCVPIDSYQWRKRKIGLRFLQSIFRLFSPLL